MNDSFAWTEQKLKRNLNLLSYFEKSAGFGSVSFGYLPEQELEP